ncbi:tRNA (adenosine(37)-N6)-threonylcarbamoyltransferase complex ATPase subunit type 1 TsaE [Anaerococcus octavius]|uniref:tRNA threonylcarbamoyladenosine biosynthesis protein TsaE n=1 Tax=Anaerococcus octavius TaxID=54007 RepID=A0A2I1M6H7_9FIRM|nr:tRNA (adenosine(37)-N6)-threonylcarbamoyltransferase complex ATPase subunit type 1 TsaE [Anaerococcus octavius]PKZ15725.1 tRNA (adenosine(37)-N6)-threonylcarbamoyltransferase complex ATPase subunit type 1 TsaE [Anaerococcus octavius]
MIINELNEMRDFAYKFASLLKENDVINLIGDMGAGKTTLTKFICEYFGINDSSSPTFAIVNIYDGDNTIYHLDLYRLEDPDELLELDYERYFYPEDAITFIEWAENGGCFLPDDMINVKISKLGTNTREIKILDDTKRGREINEYFSN